MVFRVQIDIALMTEKNAQDLLAYIEKLKEDMSIPLPDKNIAEQRIARYHKCYHDEDPTKPCEGYTDADLTRSDEDSVLTAFQADVDAKQAEAEANRIEELKLKGLGG